MTDSDGLMPHAWWPETTSVQPECTCLDLKLKWGMAGFFWTPQQKLLFLQTKEMKEFWFGVEARVKQGECSGGWG